MRREIQAVVFILLGAVLLKLVISGEYLNYVQRLLKFPLIATGVVLIAFGVLGFLRDWRGRAALERSRERAADARVRTHGPGATVDDEQDVDEHEHSHEHVGDGHGVGWLWIVPIFVLVLVPPPALGSFAAERGAATVPKPPGSVKFTALSGANPVPLEVHDYAQRAVWDDGRTLAGRTVELSGFMTPHSGSSWYLTRMKVNCCAADARPYQVEILDSPVSAVRDEWVRVTGTWVPSTAKDPFDAVAQLKATTVNVIPTPAQPYE